MKEEPYDNISLCTVKNTLFELAGELDSSSPRFNLEDVREIMHDLVNVRFRSTDRMHPFTGAIKTKCIIEVP